MLATHRADIDRLDASYSAVVLELHAGEITQRVRYTQGIEALQLLALEGLRHNDIFVQRTSSNLHFLYLKVVIQRVNLCLVQSENRVRTEC